MVQFWKRDSLRLWNAGGTTPPVEFVARDPGRSAWHSRQTRDTWARVSIRGLTDPCGSWQAAAAFETHRSMLESERSALVAVAAEAVGFVGSEHRSHGWTYAAVRIVAVDAAHGAFGETMMVGLLELCPDILVASGALAVDLARLANHQAIRAVRVNLVAGDTGNRAVGMAALQPSDMRRLVQVAGETDLVGRAAVSFAGLRINEASPDPACSDAIPWHDSQPLPLKPRLGVISTMW